MIRSLEPERDAEACDAIVRGLPAWFGLEEGIAEAAGLVRTSPGLVAVERDEVAGFLTMRQVASASWEISWMAVRADRRGHGIGRALVDGLVGDLPAGSATLTVSTLSDRAGDPGPEYRATRAFYLALGFQPVAELDVWGPENPCQLLARRIGVDATA